MQIVLLFYRLEWFIILNIFCNFYALFESHFSMKFDKKVFWHFNKYSLNYFFMNDCQSSFNLTSSQGGGALDSAWWIDYLPKKG